MKRNIPLLIVDDSVDPARLGVAFADSRFDVRCHTNAETALRGLSASRYEVAVVDLRAIAPDGKPLIEHVIDTFPRIRCVALVEKPDVASVQQAMQLGCKSYLAKPVTAEAVYKSVQEVAKTSGLLTLSEDELQLRLSRLLRSHRLRSDLTLTELALRIGLSKAQLSQIELGKSWPSFPTLKRISDELEQPFSQLFKEIEQAV